MVSLALAVAAAAVMAPGPGAPSLPAAPAYPPVSGPSGHMRPSIEALTYEYEAKAKALQAEMAALKNADGGQLTAEHLAYLQEKLIALLDAYHGAADMDAPMSVNADGTLAH